MEIYGSNDILKYDVPITSSTVLKQTLKGVDKISAAFTISEYVALSIGDYVTWRGIKYTLENEPSIRKGKSNEYVYSVDFEHPKAQFKKALVILDNQTEHFLFGTLQDHVNHITTNINRVLGTSYTVSAPVGWVETQNIQYQNSDALSALDDVVTIFDKEYYLNGTVITLVDRIGSPSGYSFQFRNGLKSITRKKLRENELVTRLYALGGERNITAEYGYQRLRIDPIERNVADFGLYEKTKIFEEVYPKRVGEVTGLGIDKFYFVDSTMEFDLNQAGIIIPGHLAKLTFNTGPLQGIEFEIISYTHSSKTFRLKEYDDGNGLVVPSDLIKPEVGDKYVLHGINMPSQYIQDAESELTEKANDFMDFASFPTVVYEVDPDATYMRENTIELSLGDEVTVRDDEMDFNILTRISELTQTLVDPYDYRLKVGNKLNEGFIRQISNKTATIDSKYATKADDLNKELNHLKGEALKSSDTPEEIPLSVGNTLLAAEAKGMNYITSRLRILANFEDDPTRAFIDDAVLSHFTVEATPRTWDMAEGLQVMSDTLSAYYLYGRCNKADNTGEFITSKDVYYTDDGGDYYYFLIGVFSEVLPDGSRALNAYGAGSGEASINNVTYNTTTGTVETGESIKQKLFALDDTNNLTDELLSKLNNIDAGGNNIEVPFQSFMTFKDQGTATGVLSKNDVIVCRLARDRIYWLQYDGVGIQTAISSYTILAAVQINNLIP